MASEEVETDGDNDTPPKKNRWLVPLIGIVVLGGAGGAIAAGMPQQVSAIVTAELEARKVANAEKNKKKAIVALDPIVVSLPKEGKIRRKLPRLSISLAVETSDAEYAEKMLPQLRNDFIAAMRLIDVYTLQSRDGLEFLRGELSGKAEAVLGESFEQLLITEFIVL